MPRKSFLPIFAALFSAAVALLSAWRLQGRVRSVDIVALFFGGFGAGAGVMRAITKARKP
ncbi:MAG TPA: hypothetical protein VKL61_10465 [Candidatus Polarisedimenticolia bacterium]|nr:hypothetical protein [Candidatus Polarisedimenticolia bacterium]